MACGIYRIRNLTNDKIYIGSSKDIKRRWAEHKNKLNKNTHANAHLQCSWNKYGEHVFLFEVVMECGENRLIEAEQEFLKAAFLYPDACYNIAHKAQGGAGPHSLETKMKISKARKGKNYGRFGVKHPMYGIKGTENPRFGMKHSPEAVSKMSMNRKGKTAGENHPMYGKRGRNSPLWGITGSKHHSSKKVLQFDLTGNTIAEFPGQSEAARETGVRQTSISKACLRKQETAGGFKWSFA